MARTNYTAIDFVANNDRNAQYFVAYTAADGNQQTFLNSVKKAVKKAKNAPLNLTLERISVFCSFVCLCVSFGFYASKKFDNLRVRLSRETLIFSNGTAVEDGMRLLHATWNKDCGSNYPMLLQTPTWQDDETINICTGDVKKYSSHLLNSGPFFGLYSVYLDLPSS